MKFSNVVVTSGKNYGRGISGFFTSVKEFQSLAESLATQGYLSEQGAVGVTPADERETAQWSETLDSIIKRLEAVAIGQTEIERTCAFFGMNIVFPVKGNIGTESKPRNYEITASMFSEILAGMKKAKPSHSVYCGFRRSVALILAQAIRRHFQQSDIEPTYVVRTFGSELERRTATILENTSKQHGVRQLSWPDMLAQARVYFNQSKPTWIDKGIERGGLFPRGTGQKLRRACEVIKEFPELDLQRRIGLTRDDPGWVNVGSIPEKDVRDVLDSDEDHSMKLDKLRQVYGSKGVNAPKIMDRKRIKEIRDTTPVFILQAALTCILENKWDMDNFLWCSGAINQAIADCQETGFVKPVSAKEVASKIKELYPAGIEKARAEYGAQIEEE